MKRTEWMQAGRIGNQFPLVSMSDFDGDDINRFGLEFIPKVKELMEKAGIKYKEEWSKEMVLIFKGREITLYQPIDINWSKFLLPSGYFIEVISSILSGMDIDIASFSFMELSEGFPEDENDPLSKFDWYEYRMNIELIQP